MFKKLEITKIMFTHHLSSLGPLEPLSVSKCHLVSYAGLISVDNVDFLVVSLYTYEEELVLNNRSMKKNIRKYTVPVAN